MSVMMNPVMPLPGPEMSTKRIESAKETESSFASHLDRQLDDKYRSNKDKLGVEERVDEKDAVKVQESNGGEKREVSVKEQEESATAPVPTHEDTKEGEQDESLVDLLAQFMAELQEVAEKNTGLPGEWNVDLPDFDGLKQLAIDAGMNEEEIAQFIQQFDNPEKKVSLTDFFAALNQYFQEGDENPPATVPETELPMLEALLAKMGVPRQALEQVSEQAVTGEGNLDLTKFLQGLQQLEKGAFGPLKQVQLDSVQLDPLMLDSVPLDSLPLEAIQLAPITLTKLETEQLQSILAQAGVTLEKQNELLPERFLNQVLGQADEDGQPVELTLERLQNILKEGIANVNENEPDLDLPAFLTDLQKIVSQSTFESQSPGVTPVVQETVAAVFQKLQEMVDLAKVKVEENKFMEEQTVESEYVKWVTALQEKFSASSDGQSGQEKPANFTGGFFQAESEENVAPLQTIYNPDSLTTMPVSDVAADTITSQATSPTVTSVPVADAAPDSLSTPEAARAALADRTPAKQLQQQIVQQLSAGVMRGLRNQEHHLTMRLYPQDLGEVKVNLTVQNEQVSVSFNMENAKVKEMLESNMQEFKDSMNQKGFTLADCFVSTGEQQESNELWQRFEMARKTIAAARETVADLPDDALYHQAAAEQMANHENGISLLV